jgi:hypothetical protein
MTLKRIAARGFLAVVAIRVCPCAGNRGLCAMTPLPTILSCADEDVSPLALPVQGPVSYANQGLLQSLSQFAAKWLMVPTFRPGARMVKFVSGDFSGRRLSHA